MVRLEEITGKAISGEWGLDDEEGTGIPVLRTTNFTNDGVIDFSNVVTRNITKKDLSSKYLRPGDIIIEKSGGSDKQPVGRVVYYSGDENKYLFNNFTGVLRVRDSSSWDSKYLFYALYANHLKGGTRKYQNKTTGLHNLKMDQYVKEFEVQDYPIRAQQHIAALLDKICALTSLRKEQLAKLDELVKARFVEMFGDPILNTKQFHKISGKELFKLSNGKTVPEEKRKASGIPAYGGNGISWYTDEALYTNDTLVVGRVGFQSGNVHLAKGPLWITDNAMYISEFYTDDFDLAFLHALMEHIDFTRYQDAGDLRKITQKPFMQMDFIYPSMELQHQYSDFIARTDEAKLTIQRSLDKLETLKKSLMQEFFWGD